MKNELLALAQRIEKQADASKHYSLQQNPRGVPNMPTLMEISLSRFYHLARELRAFADKFGKHQPANHLAVITAHEPGAPDRIVVMHCHQTEAKARAAVDAANAAGVCPFAGEGVRVSAAYSTTELMFGEKKVCA